ncbi:MAG: hypothetical protein M3024_01545 [Candidatus Dormibacteraeota bacterium]|nr:hypothetical protein [Candidatus Dormibacteraeota bacterium]
MSTRAARPPPEPSLVQELLDERRRLLIERERLRLELDELRAAARGPDPAHGRLEAENRRLRAELAAQRARADSLEGAIRRALTQIKRASP